MEEVSPLRVRVDERLVLQGDQLILPHTLTRQTFHLLHEAGEHTMEKRYLFESGLLAGDRVILLSLSGEYLLIGKTAEHGEEREVKEE